MIKGLVLFDYDGTLVDEREGILTPTQMSKEAITQLQKKEYLCMLATGRAQSYLPQGAKDLFLDGYITSNGACVTIHGKEIFHDVFSDQELIALLKDFEAFGINYVLENKTYCFVKDLQEAAFQHFLANFHVPQDNFVAFQGFTQVQGKIEKITLACKDQETRWMYGKRLQDRYALSYHRNCTTFDIAKQTIHKGSGVKEVIRTCAIPYAHTYAFGDGDNDVELMKSVAHPIAMGIYNEALKPHIAMVTDTVKEEGIYKALKKLEVL